MGLHDTFNFDPEEYRAKCAERPTVKLQEEEIKKLRQHFAASASMAIGASHAVQTAGLTLGVSAWGMRRYYVAREKLEIIRAELTKRGIPLHDMQKRDAAIPVSAAAVGVGMGMGIGHLVGGVMPAPDVPIHGGGSAGAASLMHVAEMNPELAAHGFAQGVADQTNVVGHALAGEVAMMGHGTGDAVVQAASEGSGHAAGYVAGVLAAKKAEEFLAECVGETVFAYAMEKLLDPEIKIQLALQERCSRLQGPLGQFCRGCGESIRYGRFAHCCQETDDYDLCIKCFDAGKTCACADKQMLIMQKSVAGDVIISEKGDASRRLAAVPELHCTSCQKLVTQGRYYYCPECGETDNGHDICEDCYRHGRTCRAPDSHRLFVYLRATVNGPQPDFATDGIKCKTCEKIVKQGPFYFCGRCSDGICDHCYELDKSCRHKEHVLNRFVVFTGAKTYTKTLGEKDCCQFCKEQLSRSGGGTFYCCSKCNDGCYDLCGKCYLMGAGCHDRSHTLMKCMPATSKSRDYIKELFNDKNKDYVKQYYNDTKSRLGRLHK